MAADGDVEKGMALYVRPGDSVIMVWPKDTEQEELDEAMAICAEALPAVRILHITNMDQVLVQRAGATDREIEVGTWPRLWTCGCLRNTAGAHRANCPEWAD